MRLREKYRMTDEEFRALRIKAAIPGMVQAGLDISKPSALLVCPCCGQAGEIKKRRLNTSYADEESNWMEACLDCFQGAVAQYADMWSDYYSGLGV